jgi:site-specific recombinase XerD
LKKGVLIISILSDFFSNYLPKTKGVSHNTIKSYEYAFQLLFQFLLNDKQITPEMVTFQTLCNGIVEEFLNWLEETRHCGIRTRNQRLAAISSFAKYAMKQNISESLTFGAEVTNIPNKKVAYTDNVIYFTKEEIGVILRTPNISTDIGYRDTTLMSVLYASGARAQELCDLKVDDIIISDKISLTLRGKGNTIRKVIIPDDCSKLLNEYLNTLKKYNNKNYQWDRKYLFSSQTHEHMTISCIEAIVKKYVCEAKKQRPDLFHHKQYSPHSFRHSISVHMLESGVPLPVIKNFLGHKSIQTTMIYATVTPELAAKYLQENSYEAQFPEKKKEIENATILLPFLNRIYINKK